MPHFPHIARRRLALRVLRLLSGKCAKTPQLPIPRTTRTTRTTHPLASSSTTGAATIYELETPNKYFAVERQKDLANNPVPNTEYAVNNVFLDGVRIAAMIPSGQARWFMTDQVDSVNIVTNDAGDAISAIDYLPYGETWYQSGDTGFSPKYNSQELDKESGLYFFNARHYDPEIARFETADSVVDGETSIKGWNRYMYVGGNPIKYKDPTGHDAVILQYPTGAQEKGHTAILQQNPDSNGKKWINMSKNGEGPWFGGSDVTDKNRVMAFDSPEDFFKFQDKQVESWALMKKAGYSDEQLWNNEELRQMAGIDREFLTHDKKAGYGKARYKEGLHIVTTEAEDKTILDNLRKKMKKEYNLGFRNCNDMIDDALDKTNLWNPDRNIIPNSWFDRMKEHYAKDKEQNQLRKAKNVPLLYQPKK